VSASPPTTIGSGGRLGVPRSSLARRFAREFDSIGELLRAELAFRPRRLYLALRMATIGTLGAALMAILHVPTILGPYIVWVLVGTPAAMLAPVTAVIYLAILAGVISLSVPLAGILAETPWLMLPTIGALAAVATYVTAARNVGSFGLLIRIAILDTFYGVVFDPGGFGWSSSALFGGCVVAFVLLTSFDTVLWPDPAEAILIESLGNSLQRSAERIRVAHRNYFAPVRDTRPVPLVSDMPARLEMLNRATAEGIDEQRRSVMLAAITREARLHIEIDRMMQDAIAPVPRALRMEFRADFDRVIDALVRALEELAESVEQRMRSANVAPPLAAEALVRPAIAALEARIIAERPNYVHRTGADEVANMAAYGTSLIALANLIEHPLDAPPDPSMAQIPAPRHRPLLDFEPETVRYCLKVATCVVIGFVVGLISQRIDLSVILTTIIVTALPTYGASLRKMILRFLGTAIGGGLALVAIVVVTPNFETLPAYMMACFVALYIAAYAGLGSGRTAYAGTQIGATFLFAFAGLSPSEAIYTPLWRIWGVFLGVLIVTAITVTMWPEYAHESMVPRLKKILRATLELLPSRGTAPAGLSAAFVEITATLAELLSVADDAKLEGGSCRIDADETVNVAGTLRRIASRLLELSRRRISDPTPALAPETEAARAAMGAMMQARLEDWLALAEGPQYHVSAAAMAIAANHPEGALGQAFEEFTGRIGAHGFAEIGGWTFDERRTLLSEVEAWRRLTELFADLDEQFSRVPLPPRD
jgi:Fusaric acid resistance protein family